MKAALIAQDFAPVTALKLIQSELIRRGVKTASCFGNTSGSLISYNNDAIAHTVKRSDLVILGMSSTPELARGEIFAAEVAVRSGIPFGFYTDTWDCSSREWFRDVRPFTAFLFVVNESEGKKSKALFPNVGKNIFVCGNPLWESSRFVSLSRDDRRKALGLHDADKVVFSPLSKFFDVNKEILEGQQLLIEKFGLIGLISFHPRDETKKSRYHPLLLKGKVDIRDELSREIVAASDLLLNSTSTVGIEAVMQHIPVLEVLGPRISEVRRRIYPNGWRLPLEYPHLVKEACVEKLAEKAKSLLKTEIRWNGVVGEPPTASATICMADAIIGFLS